VWAILGNHDWRYDVGAVRRAFDKVGIPRLENRAVLLGQARFWVAGLRDQITHRVARRKFRGDDDLPGPAGGCRRLPHPRPSSNLAPPAVFALPAAMASG
jgi:hypothetical protein